MLLNKLCGDFDNNIGLEADAFVIIDEADKGSEVTSAPESWSQ